MSSRDDILQKIRRQLPQATPLPNWDGDWIRYDDPVLQFTQVLESVGGVCHVVDSLSEIHSLLGPPAGSGKRIISGVPGVEWPVFDFSSVADPHDLADVELAVLSGQWAVAENAAIWVQTAELSKRTLYFIAQHLALVVPLAHVLNNMHEAYARIESGRTPFGCFISGPSKTADIEQSLVKGAHGARTLKVFLVADLQDISPA